MHLIDSKAKHAFGSRILVLTLVSLLCIFVQSAAAQDSSDQVSANIGKQFQLRVNQLADIGEENIKIKLLNVTEDSRCPSDVTCGWQGQASVMVNIQKDKQSLGNFKLTSQGGAQTLAIKKFIGQQIELVEINPYPVSTKTIALSDYIATFVVTDTIDRTVFISDGSSKEGCEKTQTCFFPHSLTVRPDSTVTWVNMDSEAHTVTSGNIKDGPDNVFSSKLIQPGQSFSHKFSQNNVKDYYCMIHPWMTGTVAVEFTPFDETKKIFTEEQSLLDKSATVEIQITEPTAYDQLGIHAYFRNSTHAIITDVNYDLEVLQNQKPVLELQKQYSHSGIEEHWTNPLRSNSPVDVKVSILGVGLPQDESNWTGPKGETVTFTAVPEFPFAGVILISSVTAILVIMQFRQHKLKL